MAWLRCTRALAGACYKTLAPFLDHVIVTRTGSAEWEIGKKIARFQSLLHIGLLSMIQGYHVFESIWNPTTGEELNCVRERTNTEDSYAVAMIRIEALLLALPHEICQPLVRYS